MAKGEYYNELRARGRKPRRSTISVLFDGAMKGFTAAVGVLLLLTLLAPMIHPERGWIFPVLGLFAPAVYAVAVLFALFWIVRWRWRVALPLVILLAIGAFKMPLFVRPELRRHYDTEREDRNGISLMTYNVRGFYDDKQGWSVASVGEAVRRVDPDIVCFQEFNHAQAHRMGLDTLLDGYRRVYEGEGHDLAVYTKFPIRGSGELDASTGVKSMWVDVQLGDDMLRIVNNHLHSTSITASDDAYLSQTQFLTDTARSRKLKGIFRRFVDNSVVRGHQAKAIESLLDGVSHGAAASAPPDGAAPAPAATGRFGGRLVVCGDFNDTPQSYVYRTVSRAGGGLDDAFAECGKGYGSTFRGFLNALRIDYVLYGNGLECMSYEVLRDVECSDHYPVVVWLREK